MAQPFPDDGAITGSEANRAAHANGGEYRRLTPFRSHRETDPVRANPHLMMRIRSRWGPEKQVRLRAAADDFLQQ
jgi:hypothetical protein